MTQNDSSTDSPEIARLKATISELENTSKMLVQRDIDLRRAYESLKVLDREKSEFISIAAHQLRTPLTAIRFANQMLSESIEHELDDNQKRVLSHAKISIDQMFNMIEDLLTVDALDYGSMKLEYASVSLEKLVASIVTELGEIITAKSLQCHTNFATEQKPVPSDARRLHDAISNIIENAVKYTPEGGSIVLTTSYTDTTATISIADTGIGVLPGDTSRLFKKFSRLSNAKLVDANGSGLGLYISKKIVEAHRGTITFTENKPQGACFNITIPL
jgi:signal transduction histidine kinase